MTAYSVQILLPSDLDTATRDVVEAHGSTWAPWGGHVTLISRFTTALDIHDLKKIVTDAAARSRPFQLLLDDILIEENRNSRGRYFVMITSDNVPSALKDVRRRLFDGLNPHIEFVVPSVGHGPFQPHVSFSLELPVEQAESLKNRLKREHVILEFCVSKITLVNFDGTSVKNIHIPL